MKVIVTGTSGFVGSNLVESLSKKNNISVIAMVKSSQDILKNTNIEYRLAEIDSFGEIDIYLGDMSVIGPRPLTAQTFGSYSTETQQIVNQVRPGLSGIGSIIFRGEEDIMHGESASIDFYNNIIAPYKGLLEKWFVSNKNTYIYFVAIFITLWTVFFPATKIAWRVFKNLPEPPVELKKALKFIE